MPRPVFVTEASAVRGSDMFMAGFLAGVIYRRLAELGLPLWGAALFTLAGAMLAYFCSGNDDHFTPRW